MVLRNLKDSSLPFPRRGADGRGRLVLPILTDAARAPPLLGGLHGGLHGRHLVVNLDADGILQTRVDRVADVENGTGT